MKSLILVVALLTIVVTGIVLIAINARHTIRLNQYVDVSISGYDGYGIATLNFDRAAFDKDNAAKILSGQKTRPSLLVDSTTAFISSCVIGKIENPTGLHNGDVVTFHWDCNDALAEQNYGLKLKYSDLTFKVKGLEEAQSFDAFSDLDVSFSGTDGYGTVTVKNNAPADSPAHALKYSVDKKESLSNGDLVTVTFSFGWYSDENMISALVNEFGALPEQSSMTYTVSGLKELSTFDPFDYIEFNLRDVSGDGKISAVVLRDEPYMKNASVHFSNDWHLSNGDTVTATVSFGYYADSEREEMKAAMASAYGTVPSRFEQTITIEGLNRYVRDVDDLPETVEQAMEQQLRDVVSSNVARSWGPHESLEGMEYVGTYVLHKKDSQIYGWNNYVDVVYAIDVRITLPDEGVDNAYRYYFVLNYRDVVVSADGEFVSGLYESNQATRKVQMEIPGHNFWYSGFADLNQVYQYYAQQNLANYAVTASGDLPTA